MSSMVPALEWKEEHHQQSNTSCELRDGLSVVSALPMFFLFTPHSTHRQALSSPYYTQGTDGSSTVLTLTQQVSGPGSRCWAHYLHPRLHRRPPPPTPWIALHQTCDSVLSNKAAALTPPLLNQPPRESKLGNSDEYCWLTYLVCRKALSSVTWGRPTGKSYTHNITVCVCMEV